MRTMLWKETIAKEKFILIHLPTPLPPRGSEEQIRALDIQASALALHCSLIHAFYIHKHFSIIL